MVSASTRNNLLKLGAVLLVGGLAVLFVYRGRARKKDRRAEAQRHSTEHRKQLKKSVFPLTALLRAPEGKTLCETAFNGFQAFEVAVTGTGFLRPWGDMPSREVFFKRCGALSPEQQRCLSVRYANRHRQECATITPKLFQAGVIFDGPPKIGIPDRRRRRGAPGHGPGHAPH